MMSAFQHAPTPPPCPAPRAAGVTASPLAPHAYLKLRREAAGLSIAEAAARLVGGEAGKAEFARYLIRSLETPGNTARFPQTLEALRSVFAFDPDVYRQLADEPADRHPRVCRTCGCSHWDPCDHDDRSACAWAIGICCTHCAPDAGAAERHQ